MSNPILFTNQDPTVDSFQRSEEQERIRRWRLILGKDENEQDQNGEGEDQVALEYVEGEGGSDGDEHGDGGENGDDEGRSEVDDNGLSESDRAIDEALDALYGDGDKGGLGSSAPELARWLGDIRNFFSQPMAQMMQQEALKKANLRRLLDEPEFLAEVEPDLELVSKLLSLSRIMPTKTKETAKAIVRKVVEELTEHLQFPLRQAIQGSLNRALRAPRPRFKEINWQRTVYANLKHYQPQHKSVVPETLVGYGKQRHSLRDVILCLDQSGSMGKSVVYGSIFGSIMASIPALSTRLVAFSTDVVDLTEELSDPVDLLFGIQLKGGTNIHKALTYCEGVVTRPRDTILVLISDLFEGGNKDALLRRTATLVDSGVQVIVLLALSDDGTPRFNRTIANQMIALGIPCFACTPDLFPELMGAAINGDEISQWATKHDIITAPRN
ncbi:MAG: VWA domain-containing protein [Chloroflexota bacterium]